MKIDWSKAPEGATHFDGSHHKLGFLKQEHGAWYQYSPGVKAWFSCHLNSETENLLVVVPQAWTGEGLPPVGTVCEYRVGDGTWFKCEIRYVTKPGPFETVEVVMYPPHLKGEQIGQVGTSPGKVSFRPIRSPEQIAEEEHRKAVEQLAADTDWILPKEACEAVLAAGYRKQAKP